MYMIDDGPTDEETTDMMIEQQIEEEAIEAAEEREEQRIEDEAIEAQEEEARGKW